MLFILDSLILCEPVYRLPLPSVKHSVKGGEGASVHRLTLCRIIPANSHTSCVSPGLQITDGRLPVMMTGQIFFSPDKPRFWPVK